MKILTPTATHELPESAREAFRRGATAFFLAEKEEAALWTASLPNLEGREVLTLGALKLSAERGGFFLSEILVWLRENEAGKRLIAPMDGNTWRAHRLVWERGAEAFFFLEPETPEFWKELFLATGFSLLATYSSSVVDLAEAGGASGALGRRLERQGVRVRDLELARLEEELARIHALSLDAFAGNFLYTPLPLADFQSSYLALRELIRPEFVLLAERAGDLLGFVFALPDPLALRAGRKPRLLVKTLAVSPRFRQGGLGSYLVNLVQERARAEGLDEAVHALKHEDNASQRISARQKGRVLRRYALMMIDL